MTGTSKKGVRAYEILEKVLYRKGNQKAHVYSAYHENTCFLLVFSNGEDRIGIINVPVTGTKKSAVAVGRESP